MTTSRTTILCASLLLAACATPAPLSPEEQMAAYQAYATPGDHHAASLGSFTTTVTMWETPGAEAQVSTGSATREAMFGGLFVVEHFRGEFMGQPFDGHGISGFDNARGVHQSHWIDSMSSGMFLSTGACGGDCSSIEWEGSMTDPMSGDLVPVWLKTYTRGDEEVMEMWGRDGGQDHQMMEIVYTRA